MRIGCWLLLLAVPLTAQYSLFTCGTPGGIFVRSSKGEWRHAGYNHPFISAFDYRLSNPATLYAAAANGLLRITGNGEKWKILTGSEVTELRDVAVDQNTPGTIYISHSAGIAATNDGGVTWHDASSGLKRKYSDAIRVDRKRAGVLFAGTEQGIYRSEDGGKSWKLAGAAGFQIMHIEQSPHDPCYWLASTQGGGLFVSKDCGLSFESNGNLGVGRNLYDIAFDPAVPNRIAVAGWGTGVMLSQDGGKTWQSRNAGLPRTDVWSVAFDPATRNRIYASVNAEWLYVSDSAGESWTKDGLEGSAVYRMKFVPEPAQ